MNPVAAPTAWSAQGELYRDPREEDLSCRRLEAWGSAPLNRYELRDVAVSLILNSHSDQINLSRLGLTEIPPHAPDRQWRRVDLSHNSLQAWPVEPPALLATLHPCAQVDLRGNPLGPRPAWAEAMILDGRLLCDTCTTAASPDISQSRDVQPAAALTKRCRAKRSNTDLVRRALLHQTDLRSEEVAAAKTASRMMLERATWWTQQHGPHLHALLDVCPRNPGETASSHVRRLHGLDSTLEVEALSAMTRCNASNIRVVLHRLKRKAPLEDAK